MIKKLLFVIIFIFFYLQFTEPSFAASKAYQCLQKNERCDNSIRAAILHCCSGPDGCIKDPYSPYSYCDLEIVKLKSGDMCKSSRIPASFPPCESGNCIKDNWSGDSFCDAVPHCLSDGMRCGVSIPNDLRRWPSCCNSRCNKDPNSTNYYCGDIPPDPDPLVNCGDARNPQAERCCFKITEKLTNIEKIEVQLKDIKDTCYLGFEVGMIKWKGVCPFELVTDIMIKVIGISKHIPGVNKTINNNTFIYSICTYGKPKISNIMGSQTRSAISVADLANPSCKCTFSASEKMCETYFDDSRSGERKACLNCFEHGGVWSAIGCIYYSWNDFASKTLFGLALALAGLFALSCIIYASIKIQISRGNPETVKKAQETMTSCIVGLLLIIFSVLILKVIGVDILRIPNFLSK